MSSVCKYMDWRPETVITFEIFQRMFDQLIPLINRIGTSSDFRSATFKFSQNFMGGLYQKWYVELLEKYMELFCQLQN